MVVVVAFKTDTERLKFNAYQRERRKNPEIRLKELAADRIRNQLPENQKKHRDTTRARNRQRKLMAIEYLGGVCKECDGTFHPSIFEFHHRNPKEKEITPSSAYHWSWKRFQQELDKCDLLCANCHRLIHNTWDIE